MPCPAMCGVYRGERRQASNLLAAPVGWNAKIEKECRNTTCSREEFRNPNSNENPYLVRYCRSSRGAGNIGICSKPRINQRAKTPDADSGGASPTGPDNCQSGKARWQNG